MANDKLCKKGARETIPQNFANDKELASNNGKKGNKTGTAVQHQIQGQLTNGKNKIITPEVQEIIRDKLTEEDSKGDSYVKRFITKYFSSALKDPNGYSGRQLANILFKDDLLSTLDRSLTKANDDDILFQRFKIRSTLYDRQQEVFDNEIDKRILIINSRRSGKTELMGRLIAAGSYKPDGHIVYINRNSSAAIRQIKGPLEAALSKCSLEIVKGSVESQEVHFSNGSQLLIIGNNNAADVDKLRGERISLCIMDECGHQRNTRQLIREIIGPALKDYADSQLVLVGTPPRIPHTFVEDCWNNPSWRKYHWTFQDNPFIPNRDKVIEEVCAEFGVTEDSAFIQREYFGRMDAYDDDAKWIKKYAESEITQLPHTITHAYVGVDWGYEDKAAVVSVLCDEITKRAYVIEDWSEAKKGITEISNEIKRQVDYITENYNLARPVKVICDNNEKSAVADLVSVYKIKNVYTAYKYDKDMALDQLNDFLSSNRITFIKDKCSACEEDANNTLWKRDEETDKILHELDDDLWHPNALMALLYVSRQFAYEVCRYTDINKQAKNVLNERDKDEGLEEIYNNTII
jgi:general stress protein YciG